MYSEKDLEQAAEDYRDVKAPEDVNEMARRIVMDHHIGKKRSRIKYAVSAAACTVLVFAAGLNLSPGFAYAMGDIPVIGKIVQLLTVRQYEEAGDHYSVSIESGEITGLDQTDLADDLNEKYLSRSRAMYEAFMAEIGGGVENIALQSKYAVKADNGITMSIEHSIFESAASGRQRYEYDTIDIQNEIYITLDSLFLDETYIEIISQEILNQMETQMMEDDAKAYFVEEEGFHEIRADHQFYINENHQLVIVFDEYEVAPGYMGSVEFIIATEKINNILASHQYIR